MNLREAAQQALEALVDARVRPAHKQDFGKYEAAITALRAALAEPEQEPVAYLQRRFVDNYPAPGYETCNAGDFDAIPVYTAPTPRKPQTTHWEGCEAVHPECRKTEHEVKDLSNYEFKTYKTGGAELEAGFYSTDELRDLVKALDKMNAATERHMRKMK